MLGLTCRLLSVFLCVALGTALRAPVVLWTDTPAREPELDCLQLRRLELFECLGAFGNGAWGQLLGSQAALLQHLPGYVLEDMMTVSHAHQNASLGSASGVEVNPPWNLGRLNQPANVGPPDYTWEQDGSGVTVYVLDEEVNAQHVDFRGRGVQLVKPQLFNITPYQDAVGPCRLHGTHVAGVIGGREYGVAKGVSLVSVPVIPCQAVGMVAYLLQGLDWVLRHQRRPAIVHMSLLVLGTSASLEHKVQQVLDAGMPVVVSAGNFRMDACTFSPARMAGVIAVGHSDNFDGINFQSNYGRCLTLFAPGTFIPSASGINNTGQVVLTGSSHAAPHVTGVVAQILQINSSATPAQAKAAVVRLAVRGALDNRTLLPDTVNLLLQNLPRSPQHAAPPPARPR